MKLNAERSKRRQQTLGYASIAAGGIAIALVARWEQAGTWNSVAAGLSTTVLLIWFQDKTTAAVRTAVAQVATGCWTAAAASFFNTRATVPESAGMMAASAQIALLATLWMLYSHKPRT